MAERFIQIRMPNQETLNKLTPPQQDITQDEGDIYTADPLDVVAGIDYDQDMTGQMEDLAFDR